VEITLTSGVGATLVDSQTSGPMNAPPSEIISGASGGIWIRRRYSCATNMTAVVAPYATAAQIAQT
jgi:hypothetical protein